MASYGVAKFNRESGARRTKKVELPSAVGFAKSLAKNSKPPAVDMR